MAESKDEKQLRLIKFRQAVKAREAEQLQANMSKFKDLVRKVKEFKKADTADSGIVAIFDDLKKVRREVKKLSVAATASGDARRAEQFCSEELLKLENRYAYLVPGAHFRLQLLFNKAADTLPPISQSDIVVQTNMYARAKARFMKRENLPPYQKGDSVVLEDDDDDDASWHGTVDNVDAETGMLTVAYTVAGNQIKVKYYPDGDVDGYQDDRALALMAFKVQNGDAELATSLQTLESRLRAPETATATKTAFHDTAL